MVKKDKKKKDDEAAQSPVEEVLVATTEAEQEPEEVQYTDTSYTSASFESLPPVIEEPKPKPKKKKKKGDDEVVKKMSSEMFNWSEESLPVVEEEKKAEEEEKEQKKPKPATGKKGKKGKEKKKEEEIPDFERPKNWKKMNGKDREVWLAERIEEWRAEQEAARQAALAGAKEKRARLARERAELMAKDLEEQEIRRDILEKTCTLFQRSEQQKMEYDAKKEAKAEWQQYLRCDGLPNPQLVTQMATYLYKWKENALYDDAELDKKCIEVLPMLEMLEQFVANSRLYTPMQAQNYNDTRKALRDQLSHAIEFASYSLLRDIEMRLKMESIKLATYHRQFLGLKLNLWVAVKMPTKRTKPFEPEPKAASLARLASHHSSKALVAHAKEVDHRVPIELAFPAIHVALKLPKTIDGSSLCVRASRSMLDLLSESSRSFALVSDLPNRYEDLFIFNVKELVEVQRLKKEQDVIRSAFYKQLRERTRELEALIKSNVYAKIDKEKEELDELYLAEPPFLPDPRTHIASVNEKSFKRYLKTCNTRTRTGELNLRKYRICGGVLNLDLLVTPPQPKRMRFEVQVTTLELPKELKAIDYKVQYRAPSPPAAGTTRTPEEIEAQMKKIEEQYERLALVSIDLPQDVLWSEPPVICQWQDQRKLWTSNYINDYKFNEDKLTIQFRTGVLWPIGMGILRYNNMPYQAWDIRPDPKSKGVTIVVTGVSVTVTWLCLGSSVKLKWVANASTPALKEHFNKKYTVKYMVKIMREAGCDLFPDFDGHNHVEGSCPKEWQSERHLYHAMAYLSRSYNFQMSRWNATAGYRNIIMQIREAVDKKREAKLGLLCVTPQRATLLKCNEMSPEFDMDPIMGMPFYPDLFTLNMSYGSVDARRETFNMKYKLVENVFNMLQELKLCSFA